MCVWPCSYQQNANGRLCRPTPGESRTKVVTSGAIQYCEVQPKIEFFFSPALINADLGKRGRPVWSLEGQAFVMYSADTFVWPDWSYSVTDRTFADWTLWIFWLSMTWGARILAFSQLSAHFGKCLAKETFQGRTAFGTVYMCHLCWTCTSQKFLKIVSGLEVLFTSPKAWQWCTRNVTNFGFCKERTQFKTLELGYWDQTWL